MPPGQHHNDTDEEKVEGPAERHNFKTKGGGIKEQLARAGWKPVVISAGATQARGSSGGAAVLVKQHLECKAAVMGSLLELALCWF